MVQSPTLEVFIKDKPFVVPVYPAPALNQFEALLCNERAYAGEMVVESAKVFGEGKAVEQGFPDEAHLFFGSLLHLQHRTSPITRISTISGSQVQVQPVCSLQPNTLAMDNDPPRSVSLIAS
ncbi:unnamed protein product [Cuscuta campestris]|uniref:Uncharacterized protein n=1 Tax=Cuscuta campestris TaxID=132261 RepID=A0A484NPL9_9ASTE|nr:unnamed protein product [Cuscuta campestris]